MNANRAVWRPHDQHTTSRQHHRFVEDPELEDDATRTAWCMCGLPETNRIHHDERTKGAPQPQDVR